MGGFSEILNQLSWEGTRVYSGEDIGWMERAIVMTGGAPWFQKISKLLISPAALEYLEAMATLSRARTLACFGSTIQMYAPVYLSNVCSNICTYCGFSADNKIPRKNPEREGDRRRNWMR